MTREERTVLQAPLDGHRESVAGLAGRVAQVDAERLAVAADAELRDRQTLAPAGPHARVARGGPEDARRVGSEHDGVADLVVRRLGVGVVHGEDGHEPVPSSRTMKQGALDICGPATNLLHEN